MVKAKIIINKEFVIGDVDKRIYGSFIEHLGRAVYHGIYEPDHPLADEDGFRTDVLDLIKEIDVPIVRYPGGNFVSGYNWTDGIGPKEFRPRTLELAWSTTETNQFGTDEFAKWCKKANTEAMMAVNLGTKGIDEARHMVEYCNHKSGSYWSDLRIKNGTFEPHDFKLWCLGNEMDGPWQIGHMEAHHYGLKANSASRAMKMVDPSIETVLCGSSARSMKTFGAWEAQTLDLCYDTVDYVSLHTYFNNNEGDVKNFLAKSVDLEGFIEDVVAVCDFVKAKRHSKKTINLSVDEWNVWYHSNGAPFERWSEAPHILEDIYDFADVLVVGLMMNAMLRHCDRVKIACLAQLVNVIAPIMTENGGKAWRQTIFYPYKYVSQYGRGKVLRALSHSTKHDTREYTDVPDIDTVSILSEDEEYVNVFAINRDMEKKGILAIEMQCLDGYIPVEHIEISGYEPSVTNSVNKEVVSPKAADLPVFEDGEYKCSLSAMSWNLLRFKKINN
ncbi:MAG TPA: alpha-N-arabinofuranosidase [Clostridiales bacterium]|nr:alpha-N-arabinofuranosidase [Clostridiales bacterium]